MVRPFAWEGAMCCRMRCVEGFDVLQHTMCCRMRCVAAYDVSQHTMCCSIRCIAGCDVLQDAMCCGKRCVALFDVLQNALRCTCSLVYCPVRCAWGLRISNQSSVHIRHSPSWLEPLRVACMGWDLRADTLEAIAQMISYFVVVLYTTNEIFRRYLIK